MFALVGGENDLLVGELYEGVPLANFGVAQVVEQVAGLVNVGGGAEELCGGWCRRWVGAARSLPVARGYRTGVEYTWGLLVRGKEAQKLATPALANRSGCKLNHSFAGLLVPVWWSQRRRGVGASLRRG